MLCLATYFSLRAGDDSSQSLATALDWTSKYRLLCAQSLVLADYTKPGRYTVEALFLLGESEFLQHGDSAAKCWVLHGLVVRCALKMGYHRDAKSHRNVSAFDAEMRRRVWHLLAQVDLLLSFQVGLPSMVRPVQSDTAPPHNLSDDDFYQATPELPPARPETERTPMSYMICKSRICQAFGMIAEQANLITRPSYGKVLELHSMLGDTYALIPSFLLIRPLDQSITDSADLIMQRFNIILLFHKSRCVLHREYLIKEDKHHQYELSRDSSISSASELLHYQTLIHQAVQPGGPLSRDKWFLTTLAAHDFLLGAMIIYLNVLKQQEVFSGPSQEGNEVRSSTQDQSMIQQLVMSHEIWTKSPREMKDAKKASKVLEIMLGNIERRMLGTRKRMLVSPEESAYNGSSAQFTPAHGDMTFDFGPNHPMNEFPQETLKDLGAMIDTPDNLDWVSSLVQIV
jgi:hypothetical protein